MTFGPGDDSQYQAGGSGIDDLFPDVDHEMDQDADADAAPVEEEEEYHTALPPKVEAWR